MTWSAEARAYGRQHARQFRQWLQRRRTTVPGRRGRPPQQAELDQSFLARLHAQFGTAAFDSDAVAAWAGREKSNVRKQLIRLMECGCVQRQKQKTGRRGPPSYMYHIVQETP